LVTKRGYYRPTCRIRSRMGALDIGAACNKQSRTFIDLAEKLKMDVHDLMRQCNGQSPPSKALVKGLAKELDIDESFLNRLAEEVRKDLG
jgi:transcriptional regulator with XRE-family HTH domain